MRKNKITVFKGAGRFGRVTVRNSADIRARFPQERDHRHGVGPRLSGLEIRES